MAGSRRAGGKALQRVAHPQCAEPRGRQHGAWSRPRKQTDVHPMTTGQGLRRPQSCTVVVTHLYMQAERIERRFMLRKICAVIQHLWKVQSLCRPCDGVAWRSAFLSRWAHRSEEHLRKLSVFFLSHGHKTFMETPRILCDDKWCKRGRSCCFSMYTMLTLIWCETMPLL